METLTIGLRSIQAQPGFPGVKVLETEDGAEQVLSGVSTPKTVWQCETRILEDSEFDTLKTFWVARHESEAFLWAHPLEGTTYTVRFVPGSWREEIADTIHWQVSFNLRQVLA